MEALSLSVISRSTGASATTPAEVNEAEQSMKFDEHDYTTPLTRATRHLLDDIAQRVADDARHHCPRGDGPRDTNLHPIPLADTITADGNRIYVGQVDGPNYWHHPEYGTPPHQIVPKRQPRVVAGRDGGNRVIRPALYWPGAEHPVARVQHPGTPEIAYMRRALYKRRGPR